jgi:predicted phosphoribosyltransferase
MVDAFVCLETPEEFMSVGSYYEDFVQVTDLDVVKLLEDPRDSSA